MRAHPVQERSSGATLSAVHGPQSDLVTAVGADEDTNGHRRTPELVPHCARYPAGDQQVECREMDARPIHDGRLLLTPLTQFGPQRVPVAARAT